LKGVPVNSGLPVQGVLADILEPIMGKGLIPADLETWKTRRRGIKILLFQSFILKALTSQSTDFSFYAMAAIVPGFHAAYLQSMVDVFNNCTERTIQKLEAKSKAAESENVEEIEVEMEAEYSNLALDIIGLSVFNYDFGSVTNESPVIQVSDQSRACSLLIY
jgi:hypothetical protein